MKRNTPSLRNPTSLCDSPKRTVTADAERFRSQATVANGRRMAKMSLMTLGIAALTLSLTACIAPIDHDDEADDPIASHGFALGTGEKKQDNGGGDTSKAGSPERESGGSTNSAAVQSGDVEEPDPVPWKGSGDKNGGGQDNGD